MEVTLDSDSVKSISHFGVVRDYVISLFDGTEISISADIITQIVEHESKEAQGIAGLLRLKTIA